MFSVANIACKTVGIAGISAALYDAGKIGSEESRREKWIVNADHFERVHDATRTMSTESHVTNFIQDKAKDYRMNNPLFSIFGSIKGFCKGFLNSLGDHILPVSLASMAPAGNGAWAKIGAWGLAGYTALMIAREGFGIGKVSPRD